MFVTLEGSEGAGKTTLARALADRVAQSGHTPLLTREPGAGQFGKAVRHLLLHGEDLPPLTELFLFLADRSHHVARVLRPALAEGKIVLCDRYTDSTVVYQGHARGLDLQTLRQLNQTATQGLTPHLTLLLDLPPEVGLARLQAPDRPEAPDRIDREPLQFHHKVRQGFLAEAAIHPDRYLVLDATKEPAKLLEEAWRAISSHLPN